MRKKKTALFVCWQNMVQRTENPRHRSFGQYGGRGIRMCQRWRESFEAFAADMGEPPAGKSIDRIDVNGIYEPGNCRWATPKQQMRNTTRTTWVELDGQRLCLTEACEKRGYSYGAIQTRIFRGETPEQAFSRPPKASFYNIDGLTLRQQAKRAGLSYSMVRKRLRLGWDMARALSAPPNPAYVRPRPPTSARAQGAV